MRQYGEFISLLLLLLVALDSSARWDRGKHNEKYEMNSHSGSYLTERIASILSLQLERRILNNGTIANDSDAIAEKRKMGVKNNSKFFSK